MESERLISELEELFKKEEHYKCFEYITKNTTAFISSISVFAAVVLFIAKAISFLVVNTEYRYWNLDEGFIVEDNNVYFRLGVYALYFFLIIAINSFAKRYVYRWELYNSQIYLYGKILSSDGNYITEKKKAIHELKKYVFELEDSGKPLHEDRLMEVKNELECLEKENKKLYKEYLEIKLDIFKTRVSQLFRLIVTFVIIFIASLLLQFFTGVDSRDYGVLSEIRSALIVALIIMVTVIISAVCEIKLSIEVTIKHFLKDEKVDWNHDCIKTVIEWLNAKIIEQEKQSIKVFFSDEVIKRLAANVIVTTVIMTIFLRFNVNYSLAHTDSFYMFNENNQDYVMLMNDGEKYIFSECDIDDNRLVIDTDSIIVRNNPISLKKRRFDMVERQHVNP